MLIVFAHNKTGKPYRCILHHPSDSCCALCVVYNNNCSRGNVFGMGGRGGGEVGTISRRDNLSRNNLAQEDKLIRNRLSEGM